MSMAILALIPFYFSSCFQPLAEDVEKNIEAEESNKAKTTIKLTTRSATGVIDYPVLVLAYDDEGNKRAQEVIASESDQLKMKLPVGNYRISALTGHAAHSEPADYSLSDAVISIPQVGYATKPLFVGFADVQLEENAANVDVIMSSRSASFSVSLKDLPATVSEASMSIAKQYGGFGMDGQYSSAVIARVSFEKDANNVWKTETIYVLPGAESQTVMTISITDNGEQYSYGYTVNEPLSAAQPYTLTGIYKSGERLQSFDLIGSLSVDSWKDPKTYTFEFGEGASSDNQVDDDVPDNETVEQIPSALTLWDGHVIALVMNQTSTEADLLLISLKQYSKVYSANASGHERDALNLAAAYNEDGMTGWKIPSNYEIQQLKQWYADSNLSYLNNVITPLGGDAMVLKSGSENARYLCDDAIQAIGFVSGSSILNAGTSAKYYLRLVKKVHVSIEQ